MLIPLLILSAQSPQFSIKRNAYGVPLITASTSLGAFEGQGYACAQDRLWQMEVSRRLSEGALASILGQPGLASDKAIDATGYTKSEVEAEIHRQPEVIQKDLEAYCDGINLYIKSAESSDSLPAQFAQYGFNPEPWTSYDSACIAIHLFKLFGTGGAGNLRDWALYQYLQMQPALKGHTLDVFNDIGWIQDKKAPTTVSDQDDLATSPHPYFANPTDADTLRQLKALPPASIFQLLPAINVALSAPAKQMALSLGVPYKTGSYCVVVGKSRSKSGKPILLSGPQMGLTSPSIDHESALDAPDLHVSGMDIPGVPGIAIGATKNLAWGITSGVADVVDTFAYHSNSPGTYQYDGKTQTLQQVSFEIAVKGENPVHYVQDRTPFGPVVLNTGSGVFALRSSYAGHELDMLTSIYKMYQSQTVEQASQDIEDQPMSFNLFLADLKGNIGWRFCGKVPIRAKGLDPRLPTPAEPSNDWRGFVSPDQMPHALNPKSGLIYNWNTKPASWWSNGDTPAWGEVFRSQLIGLSLPSGPLTAQNVQYVPWALARWSETWPQFSKLMPADDASDVAGYNGWNVQGSFGAAAYQTAFENIRKALFAKSVGNFLGTGLFDTVLQPTAMLHALEGKTRFNYLGSQTAAALIHASLESLGPSRRYDAPTINYPGQSPILYPNRGTYIQLVELNSLNQWCLETVLPPGETESGPHQFDQIPLSIAWEYKPAWTP